MTHTPVPFNNRILIIDDEESVRDNFNLVLKGSLNEADSELDSSLIELMGSGTQLTLKPHRSLSDFEVVLANSGNAGLAEVERACASGKPFACIFCDVRMPGWDGVETIERIRKIDQEAEIVFITAHSDYTLDHIIAQISPNISYFIKPFASDELL